MTILTVDNMIDTKDISVVIQGKIDKNLSFNFLKSIKKVLPKSEIILSTWEGTCTEGLEYDKLVLNQDPGGIKHDFTIYNKPRSINNFNRQLISTRNGILKVNRKYCLKLRTDLDIQSQKFLTYWNKFTIRNKKYKMFEHRVLCSSIFSREYSCQYGTGFPTPFHPSDFWLFGLTSDLKNYFESCPLQTLEEGGNWKFKYPNRLPYITMLWRFAPEQFFCVNWVKKYYTNLSFYDWSDWNQENIYLSNNILYNNFIFLDFDQSGIFSQKHKWSFKNIDFIQGLITYQHFQKQYKNYCDVNFSPDKVSKNKILTLKQYYIKFKTLLKRLFLKTL